MNKQQMNGLTLIEVCVVLAVIGTLTAVMLTRFLDLQSSTRTDSLRAAHGAVSAAATLAHVSITTRANKFDERRCPGAGFADNLPQGAGTLCMDDGLVQTWNGYPAANLHGIVSAARLTTPFNPGIEQLRAAGYLVQAGDGSISIARADAKAPERCSFTYTQSASADQAAVVSAPLVDGC